MAAIVMCAMILALMKLGGERVHVTCSVSLQEFKVTTQKSLERILRIFLMVSNSPMLNGDEAQAIGSVSIYYPFCLS